MSARRARMSLPLVAALTLAAASPAGAQGVEAPRVPLRTAVSELATVRSEYAEAFNRKDAAAVTSMFLPDAVFIQADGTTLLGRDAIGKSMAAESASWGQTVITSDTMRVFGNTAWDVGTSTTRSGDGQATVGRYLVVLRRGVQRWQISSLAVVPEMKAKPAD